MPRSFNNIDIHIACCIAAISLLAACDRLILLSLPGGSDGGLPDLAAARDLADPIDDFILATRTPTGTGPVCVAAADFNHDNRADLAVANHLGNNVTVLLGDGKGGFWSAASHATGKGPYTVIAARLGFGELDLVTANFYGNSASILTGDGSGKFAAAVDRAAGEGPTGVAAAMLDGGKLQDLILVANVEKKLTILRNHGNLADPQAEPVSVSFAVADAPWSVAAERLRPGAVDLVITTSSSLRVFAGDGIGGYAPAETHALGPDLRGAALADVDNDGAVDALVPGVSQGVVHVLRGRPGGFAGAQTIAVGGAPTAVAVADFDGDGRRDIAVTDREGTAVRVLFGAGDGTFKSPRSYETGKSPWGITAADLDGDARPDLAVTNHGGDDVVVLLNRLK